MISKLMVLPLSKKVAFFTDLGPGLSQKVGFFLIFEQIVRPSFLDKLLALSNKKSTFVLVFGVFGCCILTILPIYFKMVGFSSKRHLKLP